MGCDYCILVSLNLTYYDSNNSVKTTSFDIDKPLGIYQIGTVCNCPMSCDCDQIELEMELYRKTHPDICIYRDGEWTYKNNTDVMMMETMRTNGEWTCAKYKDEMVEAMRTNGEIHFTLVPSETFAYVNYAEWLSDSYTKSYIETRVKETNMCWDKIITITISYYVY